MNETDKAVADKLLSEGQTWGGGYCRSCLGKGFIQYKDWQDGDVMQNCHCLNITEPLSFTTDPAAAWMLFEHIVLHHPDLWITLGAGIMTMSDHECYEYKTHNPKRALCETYLKAEVKP